MRGWRKAVHGLLVMVLLLASLAGAQEGAPSAPKGLAARMVPGDHIELTWSPGSPEEAVDEYRIYAATWEGYETHRYSVPGDTTRFREDALGPHATRSYFVTAVNGAGESAPSPRTSMTTPFYCSESPPFCLVLHPVAKVGDLVVAQGEVPSPAAMVQLEAGRVRVEGAGTYAEQRAVVPRGAGLPDPSLLAVEVGSTSVRYVSERPVGPALAIGVPEPFVQVVGSLWSARFMVFVFGEQPDTDIPLAAFRQGVPGPDCLEGCNVPGMGALAAFLAMAVVAAVARRQHR